MKKSQTFMFVIIVIATLTFSVLVVLFHSSDYDNTDENNIITISPTPTLSPEPKKATVEVAVQPWHGTIDMVNGYGIEVDPSNDDELLFTDDNFSIRINVMSEYWVIQYAYFFSDLLADKVEIPAVNPSYAIGLKKSFVIDFHNVPDGEHRVDFYVVLHDGTRGEASIDFVVNTQYG